MNVDLDLKSTQDLGPLVHALGARVRLTHVQKSGRLHWCRVMLSRQPKSPTDAVLAFAKLLAKLSKRRQAIWAQAKSREFDIGIQGGFEPDSGEWVLEPSVIQAAARLRAQVRITVYSAALAMRAKRSRRRRAG